ncbi:MAG: DedA family protein [Planctomycetaceae bacterium]|jgi:membrane protein YqaA with SNARE-associated domain|nr:DedA family protein [Planctomycetaceae bacterium]
MNIIHYLTRSIRQLYDWVLSWAETPYGSPVLFVLAFMESSFFPVPPDVLQIALSVSKPRRAFWYATISLIGSVLGAILGYYIGLKLWETTHDFFFTYIFSQESFSRVENLYHTYDFWAVFIAAFTLIPYKIFTIAAGVCQISLFTLFLASVIGRGLRFYLVALLLFFFGPSIKIHIEKYFNYCVIILTILLIVGFVGIKYFIK